MGKVLSRPPVVRRATSKAEKPGRFQLALEAMEALPVDERVMINDILKKRRIAKRRDEIARAVKRGMEEFERGETRGGTAEEVIRMLRDA